MLCLPSYQLHNTMKREIILIVLSLISFTVLSQKLEIKKGKYVYKNSQIDKAEFEVLLSTDQEAYVHYIISQKEYKSAKKMGLSSVALFATGIASIGVFGLKGSLMDLRLHPLSTMLLLSSYASGTFGIVTRIKANRNKEISILLYNHNEHTIGHTYEIDILWKGSGIGLTYSF